MPEAELDKYKRALFNCQFEQVEAVSCISDGIDGTRHEIGQYAAFHGWQKFAMLDDDLINFSVRKFTYPPGSTPQDFMQPDLVKSSPQDRDEMFATVEQYLDWYAHVGVSPRFNNQAYVGEKPVVRECSRMLRFLAYRTKEFLECIHGRVAIAEDFDVTLQLLTKGYKNAVLYQWTQDQTATNSAGGCSIYRTLKLHNDNIQKLHELWPEFTTLKEKKNIDKEAIKLGLAHRLEVVINWQKAYAWSQRIDPVEAAEDHLKSMGIAT